MARKAIPKSTETQVLVESRRRCCLCFGLNRDTALKGGQIAHLDHNSANAQKENLAFLCFDHHDEYDSKTSQRKKLSIGEIKVYQRELYDALLPVLSQPVHFGSMKIPANDPYAGQYVRIGNDEESAELNLIPLPDTYEGDLRYFVIGEAAYGKSREFGPNIGILEFVGQMTEKDILDFSRTPIGVRVPFTSLHFVTSDFIVVSEREIEGVYGNGVSFEGTYQRIR
ncbi:hypothetical protein IHQ71_00380 [Rhizobium sp. TH2]|uniref:hypothetical protein n=1 Tax=Rhizobium sp. TH2 TaxID=2775403 RepID=UPI0021585C4F|nr:hypothetical protein [Rhizobium sp. TH2]UVC09130.1 hypothetical protein IHQ71_00380 [Rhizobium sp. TH2]